MLNVAVQMDPIEKIKIAGDSITELERGQGLSPFDKHKIVFTGSGPASQN